jgi:hypothetical protein
VSILEEPNGSAAVEESLSRRKMKPSANQAWRHRRASNAKRHAWLLEPRDGNYLTSGFCNGIEMITMLLMIHMIMKPMALAIVIEFKVS